MDQQLLESDEADRIAGELADKYGADALAYVEARAERAHAVGDDLAYGAGRSVLEATKSRIGGHAAL
jgi:hypothetical protein